jgi:glycosyltransferase involved in cell wall biosynthesis
LMSSDPRIKYVKHASNQGHLYSLGSGARHTASDWIALLDADDGLTPTSIESRIRAAIRYRELTGMTPQLVYGDRILASDGRVERFTALRGHAFQFLSRELCLCQTSTIMLGKECLPYFPISQNPWCTDDEMVLAVGRHFPILHSGEVVAIIHEHNSPTRMSNNARQVFRGVFELVRDHQRDVVQTHGVRRLLLWYLRLAKAFCAFQIDLANERLSSSGSNLGDRSKRLPLRVYRRVLYHTNRLLKAYLRRYFELDYF